MDSDRQLDRTVRLQELMHKVGINSFRQLYRSTGTSAHTIGKLRSGELDTLRWQTLVKISNTLQLTVSELIEIFGDIASSDRRELATLRQEYQHLQQIGRASCRERVLMPV